MSDDRSYVLRIRGEDGEDEYLPITDFSLREYRCGLKAGDRVRLIKDIELQDEHGAPTGEVHRAGEVWTVLTGSPRDPEALWMRQSNGEASVWDDDESAWQQFELVERQAT